MVLDFLNKNIKKALKVKKFIIKQLYGGKLRDEATPRIIKNTDSI